MSGRTSDQRKQVKNAKRLITIVRKRTKDTIGGNFDSVYDQLLKRMSCREKNQLGAGPLSRRQAVLMVFGFDLDTDTSTVRLELAPSRKVRYQHNGSPAYVQRAQMPQLSRA